VTHTIANIPVELSNDAPNDKVVLHPEVWMKIRDTVLLEMGFSPLGAVMTDIPQSSPVKEAS
jgi:hypothetical protein